MGGVQRQPAIFLDTQRLSIVVVLCSYLERCSMDVAPCSTTLGLALVKMPLKWTEQRSRFQNWVLASAGHRNRISSNIG